MWTQGKVRKRERETRQRQKQRQRQRDRDSEREDKERERSLSGEFANNRFTVRALKKKHVNIKSPSLQRQ